MFDVAFELLEPLQVAGGGPGGGVVRGVACRWRVGEGRVWRVGEGRVALQGVV